VGSIADLRREYTLAGLDEREVASDPIAQFIGWFEAARAAGLHDPNAMILSTMAADGPSSRTVLLKGVDEEGFVFYTNYASAKARELQADPRAALLFLWHDLERQVRIRGKVEKVSPKESATYFASRPRGAQLGAWASAQSDPIGSRAELEKRLSDVEKQWEGKEISLPPQWGGYRLKHESVEFWQGRPNRLHDRIVYLLDPSTGWAIRRLMP
jgi:pyridoxamine 5'-phosphate oxidase